MQITNFHVLGNIKINRYWLCTTALALGMTIAPWSAADAQDTRRGAAGAANVTGEANPQNDVEGKQDPDRVDESYQPKGVELGSFLLLPQVEFEQRYNSNLYARPTDEKSDFQTRIAPEFQLRSRFSRHALNLTARAEQNYFRRFTNDNHLNGQIVGQGRYDFDRSWEGTGLLEYARQHEDRGSPDEAGGEKPTPTNSFTGQVGTKVVTGRYTFSGDLQAVRRHFEDVGTGGGATINNSDRDRMEYRALVRGAYEMFPGYSAVAELQANRRKYDDEFDDLGYNRSSHGWRAEAGIGVDVTQLIRGDFLVGYLQQDYEDSRLRDPGGLAFRAVFNWTPSRLTVIIPSLERRVQETTTRGASSIVSSTASLLIRHEYSRNIVLTAAASVTMDDFKGVDQTNWTYDGRGRVIWALAPEYYVGSELAYRKRTSNVASSEYDQYIISVRLGLRL
ncbi:outer membrane beta-barrel protein [Azospirillum halopraeferens]|uniref:outer membrane beta-barrel protein n=1 Tax=Azospirillum halopraeferens TaxID=34010 RepID=UPI0009FD0716|nr:outer membrane beta-barrel protein [Azospirillum halopraeferens]